MMGLDNFSTVLLGLGMVASVVFPLLLLWYIRKKRREKLTGLAAALGGEAVFAGMMDDYVRLDTAAGEARVKLIPGGKNQPDYLELRLLSALGFEFSISSENVATRALERWGLLKEVKIGDPAFDDRYLIRSNDPTRTMMLLQEPAGCEAADYFFRQGFDAIVASGQGMLTRKPRYREADLAPGLIREHLEQLGRLAGKR